MILAPNCDVLELIVERDSLADFAVPESALDDVWGYVNFLLDKNPELWNTGHTKDSIRTALEQGMLKLWLVVSGAQVLFAFFTQNSVYPNARILSVVWGSGARLSEYIGLVLSALENVAAKTGQHFVSVEGRDGWKKPLANFGYHHLQSQFIKPVSYERVH